MPIFIDRGAPGNEHINAKATAAQAAWQPFISVDTKKKEMKTLDIQGDVFHPGSNDTIRRPSPPNRSGSCDGCPNVVGTAPRTIRI